MLKDLWSGSPATTAISNSCSTIEDEKEYFFYENGKANNNFNIFGSDTEFVVAGYKLEQWILLL